MPRSPNPASDDPVLLPREFRGSSGTLDYSSRRGRNFYDRSTFGLPPNWAPAERPGNCSAGRQQHQSTRFGHRHWIRQRQQSLPLVVGAHSTPVQPAIKGCRLRRIRREEAVDRSRVVEKETENGAVACCFDAGNAHQKGSAMRIGTEIGIADVRVDETDTTRPNRKRATPLKAGALQVIRVDVSSPQPARYLVRIKRERGCEGARVWTIKRETSTYTKTGEDDSYRPGRLPRDGRACSNTADAQQNHENAGQNFSLYDRNDVEP